MFKVETPRKRDSYSMEFLINNPIQWCHQRREVRGNVVRNAVKLWQHTYIV